MTDEHGSEDDTEDRTKVDISVILLTYNHEAFVAQAIQSVLDQTTDAHVELLISEDCSTDNTRAVVLEFAERYPEKIKVFLSPQNLNANEVYLRAYREARGEYVAYLDGDDYWLPEKLERQLAAMTANPRASLCYHDVEVVREGEGVSKRVYGYGPYGGFEELVRGNPIASASMFFRRSMLGDHPAWFDDATYIDWPQAMLLADRGEVLYLDEVLSAYREHGGGLYSGSSYRQRREWDLETALIVARHFGRRRRREMALGVGTARFRVAHGHAIEGHRWSAVWQLLRSLVSCPHHPKLTLRLRLSTLFHVLFPRVHRRVATMRSDRRQPRASG